MKIKTSELIGTALDWAVAVCEGHNVAVLTIEEQRERWMEHVAPSMTQQELADWERLVVPSIKPRICVLSADGYKCRPDLSVAPMPFSRGPADFQYSTNWLQGGPIIEREDITIVRLNDRDIPDAKGFHSGKYEPQWAAVAGGSHDIQEVYGPQGDHFGDYYQVDADAVAGHTPLIAAMRCYVASKLGDKVDVPDELI